MTSTPQLYVIYDAECGFCQSIMQWLKEKDISRKLNFIPFQTPNLLRQWPQISLEDAKRGVQAILLDGEVIKNEIAVAACLFFIEGYRWIGRVIISPLIQPVAALVYRYIAFKRK